MYNVLVSGLEKVIQSHMCQHVYFLFQIGLHVDLLSDVTIDHVLLQ